MAATAADIRAAGTGFHGQHLMDWPLLEWHINDDEIAKSRQIKADKAEQKSQSVTSLDWLALEYPIVYLCRRPHTIRKVKFVSKNSILTKPQRFHEFFTQYFLDNFSHKLMLYTA